MSRPLLSALIFYTIAVNKLCIVRLDLSDLRRALGLEGVEFQGGLHFRAAILQKEKKKQKKNRGKQKCIAMHERAYRKAPGSIFGSNERAAVGYDNNIPIELSEINRYLLVASRFQNRCCTAERYSLSLSLSLPGNR